LKFNPFWTQRFTLENYLYLFQNTPFPEWLKNTLIVSVVSTAVSFVLQAVLMGYALARLRFPGQQLSGRGIFLAYLVPADLLFLPLSQVIVKLNLYNTYWALILTYPTQLIPFASWLLMGTSRPFPRRSRSVPWRRLHPDGGPGEDHPAPVRAGLLSAADLLLHPLLERVSLRYLHVSGAMKTIPVGTVSDLIKADTLSGGPHGLGSSCGSFTLSALLYSFFVKYYVSGLTAGAVKR